MKALAIRPFAERPRPVRIRAQPATQMVQSIIGPVLAPLMESRQALTVIFQALSEHPELGGLVDDQLRREGSTYGTKFMLTEIIFAQQPHAIFELDSNLVGLLLDTDFSRDHPIPAAYCRAPVEEPMFFHFPKPPAALDVASSTDTLPLSGYYLREVVLEGYRVLEVVVVSQPPPGDQSGHNDSYLIVDIPILDENESMIDLFERADVAARLEAGSADRPELRRYVRPHLEFVSKLLVYLGQREVRRDVHRDRSEAIADAAGLGPRKREAALGRADKVYDYTRISAPPATDGAIEVRGEGTARAAHHRRGHFRLAHVGQGRAERRVVWVRPTLVGVPGPVAERHYRVT